MAYGVVNMVRDGRGYGLLLGDTTCFTLLVYY